MTYVAFIEPASALLGIVYYEGENTAPGGLATGDPVTAFNAFYARLSGAIIEDFEAYEEGEALEGVGITRNGATMTMSSSAYSAPGFAEVSSYSDFGRFNTTSPGALFLDNARSVVGSPMVFSFSTAISAWGAYLTDLGDFDGQISVELVRSDSVVVSVDIGHTISAPDGSLYFWGFVDDTHTYTELRIVCEQLGGDTEDVFGLDDVVFATSAYLV